MDTADSPQKPLCPQPKEPMMKKVSHKAPKVKAIHKDDATPETPLEEELGALDTRIQIPLPYSSNKNGLRIYRNANKELKTSRSCL